MIVLDRLNKRFGSLSAVTDLDLEIQAGELFGFLGPNGAGKTTTIRLMTGLLRPTSGRVLIGGHDVQTQPVKAKALLGYVPDEASLYEKLTGREFLLFMADLYRVDGPGRQQRMDRLLDLLGMTERAGDIIQSYSRGMRQKIALAGALVHDPRLLVMDEPTVGLDPRSARALKDLLRDLSAKGVTVFLSTHVLEIAERMCTRIAIIDRGRLVASGTMAELRAAARQAGATLEDIFLKLTGEPEHTELARQLDGEAGP
ncbi:MAG TPA: ABC transporter ATP-binding protein [Bacillota bacterium]|nr:ABC transporter ATP-binding protein [Bacillota bacterium]